MPYLCRSTSAAVGLYPVEAAAGRNAELIEKQNQPAFVERTGGGGAALPECVIEFESPGGGKMRIQWKAAVAPDWTDLLRAWHETQG
jgi:hypothetical protein